MKSKENNNLEMQQILTDVRGHILTVLLTQKEIAKQMLEYAQALSKRIRSYLEINERRKKRYMQPTLSAVATNELAATQSPAALAKLGTDKSVDALAAKLIKQNENIEQINHQLTLLNEVPSQNLVQLGKQANALTKSVEKMSQTTKVLQDAHQILRQFPMFHESGVLALEKQAQELDKLRTGIDDKLQSEIDKVNKLTQAYKLKNTSPINQTINNVDHPTRRLK